MASASARGGNSPGRPHLNVYDRSHRALCNALTDRQVKQAVASVGKIAAKSVRCVDRGIVDVVALRLDTAGDAGRHARGETGGARSWPCCHLSRGASSRWGTAGEGRPGSLPRPGRR